MLLLNVLIYLTLDCFSSIVVVWVTSNKSPRKGQCDQSI